MDVPKTITIKMGPYKGKTLEPVPYNLFSITSTREQDLVAAVATTIILLRSEDRVVYLEVDGFDVKKEAWVLCGYGFRNEFTALEVARLEDAFASSPETRGCIIHTTTDMDKFSKKTYYGKHMRGCFKVWIRAPEKRPVDDDDDVVFFTKEERSDSYLRPTHAGIQKRKKSKKVSKQEIKMAILQNRSFVDRILDFVGGVTTQDVSATVAAELDAVDVESD